MTAFDISGWVVTALLVTGFLWAGFTHRPEMRLALDLVAAIWFAGRAAVFAARHDWVDAGIDLAFAALFFYYWRQDRRGRRKAASWLGAKSRALRDRLVVRQREAAREAR